MRQAIFHKKGRSLNFFVSKNTSEWVHCETRKQAIEKIKATNIEQTLKDV